MSTIAQFEVPVEAFALRGTLPRVPEVVVEVDRFVVNDTPHVMPFLWAFGDGLDAFESLLEDDPTVERVEPLTAFEDERFYRFDWTSSIDRRTHALVNRAGAILNARARENDWHLRVLFPDRESMDATRRYCRDNEVPLRIQRVNHLTEKNQGEMGLYGLTDEQYSAIVEAIEKGYYDVPRNASARELATELDISHQALSERLRRAHKRLISNALVTAKHHPPKSEDRRGREDGTSPV